MLALLFFMTGCQAMTGDTLRQDIDARTETVRHPRNQIPQ
jgi:hypothetical protein